MHTAGTQNSRDIAFTRKSYIDGVAYLLKALPDDLDDHEASVIQRAIPQPCIPSVSGDLNGQHDGGVSYQTRGWRPSDRGRTFLRRAVQTIVARFVWFMYLFIRFIMLLITAGAYYERRYNISQHLVARGFVVANAMGRQSVILSGRVAQMGDGRVGQTVTGLAAWTVESLTGGIQDGVGEGLHMISVQRRIDDRQSIADI